MINSPLDAIKPGGFWIALWSIVSTESIQIAVKHTNTDPTPSFRHGGAGGPLVRVRVVAFDCCQTRAYVSTANRIQSKLICVLK